ncbi:YARHG domain-containing protein [Butyrivibrio sp. NC3005]|uniref:YARHG domain-containing protein n=1 Tax=Butyrivibrio sp. NC3005 TaxID=1280685 RepID=UPI00042485B7|nr:YARHG domain-containing protein [Butyrivibrio sp. NC3005]
MKKQLLILTITSLLLISGCSKPQSTTDTMPNTTSENSQDSITNTNNNEHIESTETTDYSDYIGLWSTDGSRIKDNGAEFTIEIQANKITNAYLFTQTSSYDRFAEIENITGTIENGTCTYKFTDDGWGNSGTLLIHLENNTITIDVKDFVMSDQNVIGYGIDGHYDLIKVQENDSQNTTSNTSLKKYNENWTTEQIMAELDKRKSNKNATSYYSVFLKYMEEDRECTDISVDCYPLFNTDTQYYHASDFENLPPVIIHLAKNEIYARHGYIFTDSDLNNFYLSQLWYIPEIQAADFNDNEFNEYEKYNLELLSKLDTYKKGAVKK